MQQRSQMPYRFDLARLADADDPFPIYEDLCARGAICRAGGNQWLVVSHREVAAQLRNPLLEQFQLRGVLRQFPSSAQVQAIARSPAAEFTQRILAGRDGAAHKSLRQLMASALRSAFMQLPDVVSMEAATLVASLRERDLVDGVEHIAFPYPLAVMSRIVGIPESLRGNVGSDCLTLAHIFRDSYAFDSRVEADDALGRLRAAVDDLLSYYAAGPDPRRDAPSFIAQFAPAGLARYSRGEVVDNIVFLLFAGFETSLNLLANALDALLAFPSEAGRLAAQPQLLATAIDEFLRFNSPVHVTGRLTVQPVTIAGQRIAAGRVIYLAIAAANRDPAEFSEPHVLRLSRSPNRHVAFGEGAHQCLGALVARREAEAFFRELLRGKPLLERAGVSTRARSVTFRTLKSLPLRILGGGRS